MAAENQTLNQITSEESAKDIEFHLKSQISGNKLIYCEHMNFNQQSFNQNQSNTEQLKEGMYKLKIDLIHSSNSILSSNHFKHQYLLHPEKNSEFHGAFNNFQNLLENKNNGINNSKKYLNLSEHTKQFVLTQNSCGKSISIPNNYNNKNKNIFQTFNKIIKNKNFKILKDDKELINLPTRKCEGNEKNSNTPIKKIKQNEELFEHLLSKIFHLLRC